MNSSNRILKSVLQFKQNQLWEFADTNWMCAIAGALMPLCFAPFHLWWLCWILLLPLIIACHHENAETRILRGGLFGIFYFGIGSYWLTQTLVTQVDFSWTSAIASNALIAGACALAPSTFCWLAGYMKSIKYCWLVLLPLLWIIVEDIRFQAFGGGPWMSLGHSQLDSPIAGYFPILGEVGTSGIVILISYGLLSFLTSSTQKRLVLGAVIAAILVFGQWSKNHQWTKAVGPEISVAIVQSAITQQQKMNKNTYASKLTELENLSLPLLGEVQLIIWPETVVTLEKHLIIEQLSSLSKQAKELKSTLLIGAFEASLDNHLFNTTFTLGYEDRQSYRKRHLVPLGEYVPSYLSFIDEYVPGDQYRSLGKTPELISING